MKLNLCSINPNNNGYYYEMESYNKAVSEVNELKLYISSNNAKGKHIGTVTNIDLSDRTCDVTVIDKKYEELLDSTLSNMTHEVYFAMDANVEIVSGKCIINKILYAMVVLSANGVIDDIDDPRDYKYERIAGAIVNDFPTKYTVKYLGAEVKNQGSVSACVACTIATIFEAWNQKINGENIIFSEGWNYGALRKDRTYSKGMISREAIEYSTKIGMVPKSMYDILIEMPDAMDEATQFEHLYTEASKHKNSSYYKLSNGDTRTGSKKDLEIKNALMTYDVPLFSISPKKFGSSHAICIVGWDDENDKYLVKNSWGETYGKNGIAEIDKNEFRDVYCIVYDKPSLPFTDVPKDAWYYNDVLKAYLNGLLNGKSDTIFDPLAMPTRAELAAFGNRIYDEIAKVNETMKELIELKISRNLIEKK